MPGPIDIKAGRLDIADLNGKPSQSRMRRTLANAQFWAVNGYSEQSRNYWRGVAQTLSVLLGATTSTPTCSVDDPAAIELLGG